MPVERRRLEGKRDNEPLDVAGISRWHFKHRRVGGTDMFFLTIGRSALKSDLIIGGNRS